MKRDLPYGVFGWCFLIIVASFMPWIASAEMIPLFGSISTVATAWTGSINFLGMLVPNWITVVIAVFLFAIAWLRANSVDIKPRFSFYLAFCGAGHTLFFIFSVITSSGSARLGLGCVATFVAFAAILRLLEKNRIATSTT